MPRPETLVVVVGTGTEVGKTWVGAAFAAELVRRGATVAARKPAQSFEPGDRTDADVLGEATGEAPETVCGRHRCYEVPLAPPMAAEVLGRPRFSVADLAGEVAGSWPAGVDVGLVEGAGGVRSPIADDGDNVDLAVVLAPDLVVLVADAGLGTISDIRLATGVLDRWPVVVVLNRFDAGDDLHRRNAGWLTERDGLHVVTDTTALADRIVPVA